MVSELVETRLPRVASAESLVSEAVLTLGLFYFGEYCLQFTARIM